MKKVRTKRYNVDWIRNGFCYKTTTDVPYDAIKGMRQTAKMLGETIEVEFDHYHIEEY